MIDSNRNRRKFLPAIAAAVAAGSALAFAAAPSYGQDQPAAGAKTLSLAELESGLTAQGLKVTEMDIKDLLLEVEAYDANGKEIELVLDRRTGEILSRRFDD